MIWKEAFVIFLRYQFLEGLGKTTNSIVHYMWSVIITGVLQSQTGIYLVLLSVLRHMLE